jgi:hypothetical protein
VLHQSVILDPGAKIVQNDHLKTMRIFLLYFDVFQSKVFFFEVFQNMKTKQTLEAEAVATNDIRAVDVGKNLSKMTSVSGQMMVFDDV